MRDITESTSRVSPNFGKRWVSMLTPQTFSQMEWVLCRKWDIKNTYEEERLRFDRCNETRIGELLCGEARRISLVRMRRRLRGFRNLLAGTSERRYSETGRRRAGMINAIEFMNANTFAHLLDKTMKEKQLSHIDAIVEVCKIENIDIESVPELLTPRLKKLIQNEAISINMIRKKGRKLSI